MPNFYPRPDKGDLPPGIIGVFEADQVNIPGLEGADLDEAPIDICPLEENFADDLQYRLRICQVTSCNNPVAQSVVAPESIYLICYTCADKYVHGWRDQIDYLDV